MARTLTENSSIVPIGSVNQFEALTAEQIDDWAIYHLHSVDLKDWLAGNESMTLPDLPGLYFVYFLIYDRSGKWAENLVYIGMSTSSIHQRWKSHHHLGMFTKMQSIGIEVIIRTFPFLPGMVLPETLQKWENALIEKVKPIFNEGLE